MKSNHTWRNLGLSGLGFGLAVALAIGVSLTTAQRSPAFAGEKTGIQTTSLSQVQLDAGTETLLASRADTVGQTLGFKKGTAHTASHVADVRDGDQFDEIDETDSNGQPVSVTRFGSDGRLTGAVRLDKPASPSTPIGQASALKRAQWAAAAAGYAVTGAPDVWSDPATDGWAVRWQRMENGVPVLNDGVLVRVWPDGQIGSVAQSLHPLADRPANVLSASDASGAGSSYLDSMAKAHRSDFTLRTSQLAWVSLNDTFNPNKTLDPTGTRRLAWVLTYDVSGQTADALSQLDLYVDAGDRSLLGGDEVE